MYSEKRPFPLFRLIAAIACCAGLLFWQVRRGYEPLHVVIGASIFAGVALAVGVTYWVWSGASLRYHARAGPTGWRRPLIVGVGVEAFLVLFARWKHLPALDLAYLALSTAALDLAFIGRWRWLRSRQEAGRSRDPAPDDRWERRHEPFSLLHLEPPQGGDRAEESDAERAPDQPGHRG